MTWILYSGYEDREDAERVFGELLELGIASEDLSLIARSSRSGAPGRRIAARFVDSGQTHLEELRLGPGRVQAEGVEGIESSVGGGIGTDSYDDDVSTIEEMDESQEVAERVAEPLEDRWYGKDEFEDALRFAIRGRLDATLPDAPGFGKRARKTAGPERAYSNEVLGRVLILGDGPLATEMLAVEVQQPAPNPPVALKTSLNRVGVAAPEVIRLARLFEEGGAVLAVTQTPGKVSLERVEALLEATGAQCMRSFVWKGD